MFCPKCRTEYRPEYSVCADCRIDLVEELPDDASLDGHSGNLPSAEEESFVVVLESIDPSEMAMAQKLLDDQGIPYRVNQGSMDQDGFSPVFGGTSQDGRLFLQLLVPWVHEPGAQAALAEFMEGEDPDEEPTFAELPPELAGGDDPLPGELEDERLLQEFEDGDDDSADEDPGDLS